MNIIERIIELEQQEQRIGDRVVALCTTLNHSEWNFYINTTQYDNPRISAWKPGGSILAPASFIVKGGSVEINETSIYPDTWKEAEAIINKWLDEGFLGGER